MKLNILLIFIFLLSIPISIAYADHIVGYDDRFYIKEFKDANYGGDGNCSTPTYGSENYLYIQTNNIGRCGFFKQFLQSDLDGQQITLGLSIQRTGGQPTYSRAEIWDGFMDVSNSTQFPVGADVVYEGAGVLYNNFGTSLTTVFTPDLTASTETYVTLNVNTQNQYGAGYVRHQWSSLTVDGLGTWRFPFGVNDENEWAIIANQTGGTRDYWTIKSFDFGLKYGIPDPPTNLQASVVNNTAVTLTWSDPTDDGPLGRLPTTDNIYLYYKNGTNTDSNVWTYLGSTGAGVGTFTSNIFEDGQTYSFMAISNALRMISDWSNIDTITMTGTAPSQQTYDVAPETYSGSGKDDNFYYIREKLDWGGPNPIEFDNGCNAMSFQSTYFEMGSSSSLYASACYGLLTFDRTEMIGTTWDFGANNIFARTGGVATYYNGLFWDGDLENIWNSTIWRSHTRYEFSDTNDGKDYIGGAGLLIDYGLSSAVSGIKTPDFSSATTDKITFVARIEDEASNGFVSVQWRNPLEITGVGENKHWKFQFPISIDQASVGGIRSFLDGTRWDMKFVQMFTPPKAPTIDSIITSGPEATVSLTPSYNGGKPLSTMNIYKQCDADSDWALQNVPYSTSWVDEEFAQTLGSMVATPTETSYFDFSSSSGWVSGDTTPPAYYSVNTSNQNLEFDIVEDNSNDYIYYDLLGAIVDPDNWTVRGKITFNEFGHQNWDWFMLGISSGTTTNIYASSQDFIGWRIVDGPGVTGINFESMTKDGATMAFGSPSQVLTPEVGDYWFEIIRSGTTSMTVNIFDDDEYTNLVSTSTKSVPASVVSLRYLKSSNAQASGSDNPLSGTIDDVYFWNGENSVSLTRQSPTPKNILWCDYKIALTNEVGAGWNSTAVRNEVGGGAECRDISTHQLVFDWDETVFDESLQGYGVQYSTDGVTFINNIANTFNTQSQHLVTGLDDNTLYYLQWRNVFFNGTYGDWSSSTQCTTLQSGSGGGPPPPEEVVCTPQQKLDPNHKCFIPEDECEGLTDINISSTTIYANLGDTKNSYLNINWKGDDNLRIEEFLPDESTGIKIAFQQPVEYPNSPTFSTTSQAPFTVQIPYTECVDEQTPKCVYNNAEYEIPIKIFAESCQEEIKVNTTVKVNFKDEFIFPKEWWFFIIGGIMVLFFVIAKRKKKKPVSRKKTLKTKIKPKM